MNVSAQFILCMKRYPHIFLVMYSRPLVREQVNSRSKSLLQRSPKINKGFTKNHFLQTTDTYEGCMINLWTFVAILLLAY